MANKSPIVTSRTDWQSAVEVYRSTSAAVNDHPYCSASPHAPDYDELAAAQQIVLKDASAKLKALLELPAPDEAALAEKLSIFAKEFGSDEELTAVVADAHRLLLRESKPSPIMAMHARYEQTMTEYGVVEKAEIAARKDKDESAEHGFARGLRASCREADALRIAILHQVPDSWTEAMILQFHIVNLADMLICNDSVPDFEQVALQTAIDTLFDFMCCEVDQDHGEIGANFQSGANRVFFQRRYRTGVVGD